MLDVNTSVAHPGLHGQENALFSWLAGSLLIVVFSGYLSYFYPGDIAVWQQWVYLYHTFLGYVLVALLVGFIGSHFKRTLGVRRPLMSLVGILAVFVIIVCVYTGLHMGIEGQSEQTRYIYTVHVVASSIGLMLVVAHILSHRLFFPKGRANKPALTAVKRGTRWNSVLQLLFFVVFVLAATFSYGLMPANYSDIAAIQPYELSYGSHPFRPSQTETSTSGFLDAKRLNVSQECGVCHAQIFKEWQASMHSKAASDRAYQTNINLLAKKKGMAATRYCEGCHVPVALLSGQLSTGGKLDTYGHLHEGVGCLGCHGIGHVLNTNGVASYRMDTAAPYLFTGVDHPLALKVRNFLIKLQPTQHRNDMARAPLATSELCASCHAQFMDKDINGWGWVKMQDDYSAWLNSPFSRQSDQPFAQTSMQRCQDCHFPLEKGVDPSANTRGEIVSHRSLGANTAIPYIEGDMEQVSKVTQFLQSNRIRVSIDKPTRQDAVRSSRFVEEGSAHVVENPGYYYLGEMADINVVVSNFGVGHDFPGGTADINEVWLHIEITDGQGRIIFESGAVDENGNVDDKAFFYRSIPVDRQGGHVWRHDLFRMVGDSYKKVIEAGSSDVVNYKTRIPSWAKGNVNINATVCYRKLTNVYAKWALSPFTGKLPVVDVAAASIKAPLRMRQEATN